MITNRRGQKYTSAGYRSKTIPSRIYVEGTPCPGKSKSFAGWLFSTRGIAYGTYQHKEKSIRANLMNEFLQENKRNT